MIKFVEFSNRIELEKLKSLDDLCMCVYKRFNWNKIWNNLYSMHTYN